MQLFLFQILEVKNYGVKLVCLTADGSVQFIDKPYTPYFYAVNMPVSYRRDIKKSTVETSQQTKPYIGFVDEEHKVIKMRSYTRGMITWKNIHETNAPMARQFCEENNLSPSSWFDSESMTVVTENQSAVPDFLICAFDIECYSATGAFTDASNAADTITMICLSFERLSKKGGITSYVLTLDAESYTKDGEIVEQCGSEEALLQRFACIVKQCDPDILTGYNIDNFDMKYMHTRLQDKVMFYKTISRTNASAQFSDRIFKSAQKGTYNISRFIIPGRTTIDMLPCVTDYDKTLKYDKKLKNFKLDTVCKQVLGGASKTGFSVEDIFRAHETKCPHMNQELVKYNIQDCVLVLDLQNKLQVILSKVQLSQISWTCLDDVIHRGVTCRVTNIVSKYAHDSGFYINTPSRKRARDDDTKPSTFQGAHCFKPVVGIHSEHILGLDFASLYPSIIRRYNIDPSTLVLEPTTHSTTQRGLADDQSSYATFVTNTKPAPIPLLLEQLGKSRIDVKKQMKNATGSEYDILNQRQLAIKIMMNSAYGFLGSSIGPIGHPELAAAVTAYGRDLIRGTASYILTTYPGSVIVGGDTDSVYCTLPSIEKTLEACFAEGHKITVAIGEKFGYPISLEMEKVYSPMLYTKKKMYAAIMYTHPNDKGVLDVKGLASARGDSSSLTKSLQLKVIDVIMQKPHGAWEDVKALVSHAVSTIRERDTKMLIKSRKLGSNYKHPERQVQACVAKKMADRGQTAPNIGDRVYYLVGEGDGGVCQRADNPDDIENIDYAYYIDSQICQPMDNILQILCPAWKSDIQDITTVN